MYAYSVLPHFEAPIHVSWTFLFGTSRSSFGCFQVADFGALMTFVQECLAKTDNRERAKITNFALDNTPSLPFHFYFLFVFVPHRPTYCL